MTKTYSSRFSSRGRRKQPRRQGFVATGQVGQDWSGPGSESCPRLRVRSGPVQRRRRRGSAPCEMRARGGRGTQHTSPRIQNAPHSPPPSGRAAYDRPSAAAGGRVTVTRRRRGRSAPSPRPRRPPRTLRRQPTPLPVGARRLRPCNHPTRRRRRRGRVGAGSGRGRRGGRSEGRGASQADWARTLRSRSMRPTDIRVVCRIRVTQQRQSLQPSAREPQAQPGAPLRPSRRLAASGRRPVVAVAARRTASAAPACPAATARSSGVRPARSRRPTRPAQEGRERRWATMGAWPR